jgi:hypothetical protein
MEIKDLKEVLNDPRLNVSGICKGITKKGMSRASVLNKMNDDHKHQMKDEDVEIIRKQLRLLSLYILEKID